MGMSDVGMRRFLQAFLATLSVWKSDGCDGCCCWKGWNRVKSGCLWSFCGLAAMENIVDCMVFLGGLVVSGTVTL